MTDPKIQQGAQKPPLAIIPLASMEACAMAFKEGRRKYGKASWRGAELDTEEYCSAILRHAMAITNGEWIDPDSGNPHAAHIMATAAILIDSHAWDGETQLV